MDLGSNKMTIRRTEGVEGQPLSIGGDAQLPMFSVRQLTREIAPNGAHIAHCARAEDGQFYFCKHDRSGFPCRMREALFSQLALEVNLPTPPFRIVEDIESGETYFGSQRVSSTLDEQRRKRFLRTERKDELGRYQDFPGRWLSQLYTFDLFIHNEDRAASNIIAMSEGGGYRLAPIDFSAAELGRCAIDQFLLESCETVQVARPLRRFHGFFPDSAKQMVQLLKAVPSAVFEGFFKQMPLEWIDANEREVLCELWSGNGLAKRLDVLWQGLEDGTLL